MDGNIKIVIGSWGSYNECNERALGSKWLDLSDYNDWEQITDELKEEGFILDGIDEELFIQDVEGLPSGCKNWDYTNPQTLFETLYESGVLDDELIGISSSLTVAFNVMRFLGLVIVVKGLRNVESERVVRYRTGDKLACNGAEINHVVVRTPTLTTGRTGESAASNRRCLFFFCHFRVLLKIDFCFARHADSAAYSVVYGNERYFLKHFVSGDILTVSGRSYLASTARIDRFTYSLRSIYPKGISLCTFSRT